MLKIIKNILVLSMFLLIPQVAWAADKLTPKDKANLTRHLNTLANGWDKPSVDAANKILTRSKYKFPAWKNYFSAYFAKATFTDDMANYLQYVTFCWFDHLKTVRRNLQEGLARPLIKKVSAGWSTALADGDGKFFENNLSLKQDIFNSQKMLALASAGKSGVLSARTKRAIYKKIKTLINTHPSVLKKSVTFNRTTQPYFGTLRAQAFLTLLATAKSADRSRAKFTTAVKADIANTIGLAGGYAKIWNNHTVLLLDNNIASTKQKRNVKALLTLIPAKLHNTTSITIKESLDKKTNYLFGKPYDGVNVFGLDVGVKSENPFPNDTPASQMDLFTAVLAHELNHVVDVVAVKGDDTMAARRQVLLDAAGQKDMNYLRSMHGGAFFHKYPQEFIASISNQWFADSGKTIKFGLARFDNGFDDPLNQALFFAEIYSLGGKSTLFYEISAGGEIKRYKVPLSRNRAGFINKLTFDDKQYLFKRDSHGNVTGYRVKQNKR